FNLPAVASVSFEAKKGTELIIERLLIYPNPISKDGYVSFILSSNAEVNIGIYTIRGNRIKNIKTSGRQGFNSIRWDGLDDRGNNLANNTYFVKVTAKNTDGKSVELTEKMVVYK
ncbi:MAG: FlgD immunoglobulin-like domain containing protein, partial [Candidatus Cloacimonetes bacterium]|nr:FlgD immunoglobulin-like domain containing protein [Candidatus Cloacimonadota bacterium]